MAALGRPGYINLGHSRDYAGQTSVQDVRLRAFEVLDGAYDAGIR